MFASATLSLAALECFVHIDPDLTPSDLVAIGIDIPSAVPVSVLDPAVLPAGWRAYPAPPSLASIGGAWARETRTAVLAVPSAVVPLESNYLLDPAHPDFGSIAVVSTAPFRFDPRMRS